MLTKKSRNEVIMNDYSYYCALWTICYSLNTWNFGAGVLRTKTIKSVVFHNRPLFLCAELTSFCVLYEKGDVTLFIIGEIHVPFKLQTIRCRQINFRVNWLWCVFITITNDRRFWWTRTSVITASCNNDRTSSLRWWTGVSSQADIIWNITTVSLKMMLFSEA